MHRTFPLILNEDGLTYRYYSLVRRLRMPAGNGTGPAGLGPMTGRGAGYCAGFMMPGYMTPSLRGGYAGWGMRGRGFIRTGFRGIGMLGFRGRGRGGRGGFGRMYAPPVYRGYGFYPYA